MERDFLGLNWKNSSSLEQGSIDLNCVHSDNHNAMQLPFSLIKIPSSSQVVKASEANNCYDQAAAAAGKFANNSAPSAILPFSSNTCFAFYNNSQPLWFQKENISTLPLLDKMFSQSSSHDSSTYKVTLSDHEKTANPTLSLANQDYHTKGFGDKTDNNYLRDINTKPLTLSSPSLTIFYHNGFHVYGEKAANVKHMAGKNGFHETSGGKQTANQAYSIQQLPSGIVYPVPNVPMARKATLARFLQKRKHRLTNARPYVTGKWASTADISAAAAAAVAVALQEGGTTSSSTGC